MQAGPIIRQQFGLDRTEWPFRKILEAQLEQLHTEYLRAPIGPAQDTMPVKRAELRTQPDQVGAFKGSWIGRNLIGFGGTIARQYTIDARLLEVDEQYRKVALISHDNGEFTVRQSYYASAKTGAKKDHHRWMKATVLGEAEMPQYVKIPRKRMEAAGRKFYTDHITLDKYQPLLVIETRFKPEFKDHASGEYLHAVSLLEMTIQQDANLVQKPLVEVAPPRGWFNFGHGSQPEAPAVQFNHLRDEFEDALNDAEKLQREHTQLQGAHQLLTDAKNKVDQTLLERTEELQESAEEVENLNNLLETAIKEKADLGMIRDGLETSLEAEQAKTKQLRLDKKSLETQLQEQQKAHQALNQTLESTSRDLNAEQAKVQERDLALGVREANIKDLTSNVKQLDAKILDLHKQIEELVESNKKLKADAEAAATFAAARVKQLEEQHTRAFSGLEAQHQAALKQQTEAYEARLKDQSSRHQQRVQQKDNDIQQLRDALSASERQAAAERANLNRKLDVLIQAYAALKGEAQGALQAMHTARVQDFARLQMILNRSGFYDLMHAIKKPFVWGWHKLTRHVPVLAALAPFAEPDFLKVDPRSVIAEVDKKGERVVAPPSLVEGHFDFSMPVGTDRALTHGFNLLRSNSGSDVEVVVDHEFGVDVDNINQINGTSSLGSAGVKPSERAKI